LYGEDGEEFAEVYVLPQFDFKIYSLTCSLFIVNVMSYSFKSLLATTKIKVYVLPQFDFKIYSLTCSLFIVNVMSYSFKSLLATTKIKCWYNYHCCRTGNKNDEKQRREDLVKGGWREDPEPFILVCCIKQCYKRGLRFCCVTFLLVYYFGNAKIHCIFSKNEKKFPASAGLVLYSCVTAGFMIYL
jgi:hypothetical protein